MLKKNIDFMLVVVLAVGIVLSGHTTLLTRAYNIQQSIYKQVKVTAYKIAYSEYEGSDAYYQGLEEVKK